MYEHRSAPVLSRWAFGRRIATHIGYVLPFLVFSLGAGTAGFKYYAGQCWIDAFLNTAMLLGGMGPVGEIHSSGGKVFAAIFALYAGLFFIAGMAVIAAPVLHRVLHKLHADETSSASRERKR